MAPNSSVWWTLCFWILRILGQSLQTEPINNMESAWLSIPQFIFHCEVNRWSKQKERSSSSSSSSDSSTISLTGGLSQVWAAFFTERLGHYISWSRSRPHPWASNTGPCAQCVVTEDDWSLWWAATKWSLLACSGNWIADKHHSWLLQPLLGKDLNLLDEMDKV